MVVQVIGLNNVRNPVYDSAEHIPEEDGRILVALLSSDDLCVAGVVFDALDLCVGQDLVGSDSNRL